MTIPEPFYLLIGAIIVLLAWIVRLDWRLRRLLAGKNGASLEEAITALADSVGNTDKVNGEIKQYLIKMEDRLRQSIQHVKTVRFNPFPERGGNQSFATAFLDEHGNGAIISTIYSRDKTSVYAKPVKNRASEFELSQEEREALVK